jgi:hypothetical protein
MKKTTVHKVTAIEAKEVVAEVAITLRLALGFAQSLASIALAAADWQRQVREEKAKAMP